MLVLCVLLSACLPDTATAETRDVSWLYGLFMIAAAVVFAVVAGLIGWSIVRYRASGGGDLPRQTASNIPLEIMWWALPTLLVIVLTIATTSVLGRIDAPAPDDALTVEVNGFQWGWRFTFPNGGPVVTGTANDPPRIELPIGRPVTFVLTSSDVVHSFYVPAFLMKRDNVPGQVNHFTVTIDEEGTYGGQCGEFCGLLHEGMRFEIDAVPPADFDAWLADEGSDS